MGPVEYARSPNGNYTANATNMKRGRLLRETVEYIQLQIIENATRRVVWNAEYQFPTGAPVPDYGMRGHPTFISWTADSSAVSIPVNGDRSISLILP
jgi:hypothetical protein